MVQQIAKSITTGIKRRWAWGISQAFSVAGALWLLTEIGSAVSPPFKDLVAENGRSYLALVLFAGAIWFFRYTYERRSVSFHVPTTDTLITIKYGDIFEQDTDWLIGVNEFFDSEIGQLISPTSLHGQFILKTYQANSAKFRSDVDSALLGCSREATQRGHQPTSKFPIGTTAVIKNGSHNVFLVAMAHTDLTNGKASSTVPILWVALLGALHRINNYGNGAPISLPLIGNGQSSVNIQPQHLLRLITLALVDFGRKVGLPKSVQIVVPEQCFEMLDLQEIQRDWRLK